MLRTMLLMVLFTAACAGLVRLGLWQLDRAEEKRVRHDAYLAASAARPLDFDTLDPATASESYRWRKVRLQGHYTDFHILLDNRTQAGQTGYEVLTAFAADAGRSILVNRGWAALGSTRDTVPPLSTGEDPLTLTGYLGEPPVVGLAFNDAAREAEWLAPNVLRVQRLDLAGLEPLLERPLWPAVVYLDPGAGGALAIDWPKPGSGAARHTAYAVQWFAMAAVLAGIGLWNLRKVRAHG